ncbi:uncharacterized protein B0I36DRAFT_412480 [Microdochium trichocladiopsis]|uniref:Uncharacterized protein n=1 Tax=Microdochium trichocladiopsis TaxID=1682393 RepID=A0A9P8Y8B4_9PEZI|nr:uncharacterized protein B0I36DRAFT_412480 [Microdochium trichocladiopsis]KAH7029932.1 hypothetical protein B0I36DRAFT_412480 [Microdochium trichocladiopsis]
MPLNPPRSLLHLAIGIHPGSSPFISTRRDEIKISGLVAMADRMMARCERTASATSRTILCWFRSTRPDTPYIKPFTLVSMKSSRSRYYRLLQRFVAFVFRAFRLPTHQRLEASAIRFDARQQEKLKAIWDHRAWGEDALVRWRTFTAYQREDVDMQHGQEDVDDTDKSDMDTEDDYRSEDDPSDGEYDEMLDAAEGRHKGVKLSQPQDSSHPLEGPRSPALAELLELLFELCIMFCMQSFSDGDPSSALLIYFSGILGISPDCRGFRTAKLYTPHLSALIYIQRLLFLEYSLPLEAYNHIGIPRRPRFHQHERLDTVRQKYMLASSITPLPEMLSLRDYGRVIARTDPPAYFVRWSDDLQTISYGDSFSVAMNKFRRLAEYFITQSEETCRDLILGLRRVEKDIKGKRASRASVLVTSELRYIQRVKGGRFMFSMVVRLWFSWTVDGHYECGMKHVKMSQQCLPPNYDVYLLP